MKKDKYYTGIDLMRLICAMLIVAIHTSPLAVFGETGDFILTRIIARVAVPFFLMTSGFFLITRYGCGNGDMRAFVKKTGFIYAATILLYLPLNIYNGYFSQPNLLPNIVKDLIFDGTFYHLWYLPASMIGAVIARYLIKSTDLKKGLTVAGVLYLIGLFGDSYYGIAEKISVIKGFYGLLFDLFDYTRNGILFAPVFLLLGGLIAEKKRRISLKQSCAGFIISFALMFAEAMLLHYNGSQRHDSMYVFLLPCMYFLFNAVLHFRGKRIAGLRTASLLIYIIHPMMIVVVRAAAKLFHLQSLLIENSLVQYFAVCLLSAAFGFIGAAVRERIGNKPKHRAETERAYIEIDLNNLSRNAEVLRDAMPQKCELMAVVKTEAYGHGAYEIATHLEKTGIRSFAVATVDEGIKLRKYGIRGEILILGYTDVHRAKELKKFDLTQTLIDFDHARRLNMQKVTVKTHIAVDSGMHRLGFAYSDPESVKEVFGMKYLKTNGIFTHLCCCESLRREDVAFTKEQIQRFYNLIGELKSNGVPLPKIHIQSSYGLLNYPDLECDYVRVGIALYGIPCSPKDRTVLNLDLHPVLSLKAKIALVRNVPKGEYVGYDRAFRTERDSRIAILPIGYGDGFPRDLSCGNAYVRIENHIFPIIGRICMDQLAVDITDAEDINAGDTAVLIDGTSNTPLSAPDIAERSGSISNELLSRLGKRLPVVLKEDS